MTVKVKVEVNHLPDLNQSYCNVYLDNKLIITEIDSYHVKLTLRQLYTEATSKCLKSIFETYEFPITDKQALILKMLFSTNLFKRNQTSDVFRNFVFNQLTCDEFWIQLEQEIQRCILKKLSGVNE